MKTKLSILLTYIHDENWRAALKLASSFHCLGPHKKTIQQGWEAFARPNFYKQIGKDPEQLINCGVSALKEKYL